jgi:plastocyanin domain-containing protein
MENKNTIYAILIAAVLISGSMFFFRQKNDSSANTNKVTSTSNNAAGDNVLLQNGKQIVNIDVKGGYWPRKTVAKSGIPTIVRFKTNNTFDCSLSVRLPSEGIRKILPQTGSSDIDIGISTAGQFFGTCGMGMYSFEIDFN